ncbi:MAG: RIP metalloprotease RseP [Candidatus Cryptobacteroides sp.]|nr:RIP metalloprotease RseP [Bacteroidales bacterium]
MVILIKILQVIVALSLLVFIHELGHFAWAKLFHIKVEKFYLFFDIGGKAIAKWKWGETEFGIGWLPLGGYCKIAGMVDESMDMEQLKSEPKAWEFRTHPAWQRLLVMAGGVLNNFIFAFLTYICIMWIWGQSYIDNANSNIYVNDLAYEMGFRNGDRILKFDDYSPRNFGMLQADLARRDVRVATVLRGTDTLELYIDHAMMGQVLNSPMMFDLAIPFVVDSVSSSGPNSQGQLRRNDRVIAFAGEKVDYLQDSRKVLEAYRGQDIEASVVRGADTLLLPVRVDSSALIGVYMQMPDQIVKVRHYGALDGVGAGLKYGAQTIGGYIQDLKLLFTPSSQAYKSVGSFIAIGEVFPSDWDAHQFLSILALLSIILAVMNLLPIPALDGGHILFLLIEMITGRKPSDKVLAVAQVIGMVFIFALMFLAIGNDIGRLLR